MLKDTYNSTDTALNTGAIFTGIGRNLLEYKGVLINVKAVGSEGTLDIQTSHDSTNWTSSHLHYIRDNDLHRITLDVEEQFYRLVYTNGATNQTSFSINCFLSDVILPKENNNYNHANVYNYDYVLAGSHSVPLNIKNHSLVEVYGEVQDNTTSLVLEVSQDGVNWHSTNHVITTGVTDTIPSYPVGYTPFYYSGLIASKYVRVYCDTDTYLLCSLVAK